MTLLYFLKGLPISEAVCLRYAILFAFGKQGECDGEIALMRTPLLLPLFLAVLVQSPAESCAAMESPAELRILHTADGQGEVFPCG
jgi:hypothetical protein